MFEKDLSDCFKKIFGFKKVRFEQPGESQEQECLFVDIDIVDSRIKDKRYIARVTGSALIYANSDKLPFGFFAKCIDKADAALKKDLFFTEIEANSKTFQNIAQRTFSFIYFVNKQFDPEKGQITSIETNVEVRP